MVSREGLLGGNETVSNVSALSPHGHGTVTATGRLAKHLFWPAVISVSSFLIAGVMTYAFDLIPVNMYSWMFYILSSLGLRTSAMRGSTRRIQEANSKKRSIVAAAARAGRDTWDQTPVLGAISENHQGLPKSHPRYAGSYYLSAEHHQIHQLIAASNKEHAEPQSAAQATFSQVAINHDDVPLNEDCHSSPQDLEPVYTGNEDSRVAMRPGQDGTDVIIKHSSRASWRDADLCKRRATLRNGPLTVKTE